jgi:hypothetical protein
VGGNEYLDAWHGWASGQPILSHELLGISILWWGRIGEIAVFLGGLTVVLDLIGPERLRAVGNITKSIHSYKLEDPLPRSVTYVIAAAVALSGMFGLVVAVVNVQGVSGLPRIGAAALFLGAFGVGTAACLLLMVMLVPRILRFLVWILDSKTPAGVVRYVGLFLIAAGFHFELLAS